MLMMIIYGALNIKTKDILALPFVHGEDIIIKEQYNYGKHLPIQIR